MAKKVKHFSQDPIELRVKVENVEGLEDLLTGEGVDDYNLLSNQPIKNAVGTDDKAVVVKELTAGTYMVSGICGYEDATSTIDIQTPVMIRVEYDRSTANKIASFSYVDNGATYICNLIFKADGMERVAQPLGGGDGNMQWEVI